MLNARKKMKEFKKLQNQNAKTKEKESSKIDVVMVASVIGGLA